MKPMRLIRSFIFLIFLLAGPVSMAQVSSIPENPSSPDRVTIQRGRESLSQELNLGPDGTALWRKIRYLMANLNDVRDFSKLVTLFDLSTSEPIDLVSAEKPGFQSRFDITGKKNNYLFKKIGYFVVPDLQDKNARFIQFYLSFYLRSICISSAEVHRVFGPGLVGISGHGSYPANFYSESAGVIFSEAYGKNDTRMTWAPVVFSYVNSGCLERIEFSQPID